MRGGREAVDHYGDGREQAASLDPAADPASTGPKPPRERLAEAAAQLADFRRRQGRFPEARRLLNQARGLPAARLVEAAMTLDRGDAAAAAGLAERLLDDVPGAIRPPGPACSRSSG